MKNRFYITGVPGSGKSAIVRKLRDRGMAVFDLDEINGLCYWRNKMTFERIDYHSGVDKEWLNSHEWVCDIQNLKKLLNSHCGNVIIGGLAANQNEYLPLFDKVFLLQCPQNVFIDRLKSRTGKDEYGQTPAERSDILSWYQKFEKDLIDKGAIRVNTEGSIERATNEILSIAKK